jgi:putative tricarboxylic transport membrane protein
MRFFPYILRIPYHYLYSSIVVLCFIGAYIATNTEFNIYLMLAFGGLGVLLSIAGISTTPLILGFILGPMLELNFRKGLSYSNAGVVTFVTRPLSLLFLIIALFSFLWPWVVTARKRKGNRNTPTSKENAQQ